MKSVYLTIDDSPTSGFSAKYKYLKQKAIPAVFFCIGNLIEKRPAEIIDAIQHGFHIGNHSYSHPSFSNLSIDQCYDEIRRTDEIIAGIYQKANVEWKDKWFRFPYGDKGDLKFGKVFSPWKRSNKERKDLIQAELGRLGYVQPAFDGMNYKYMKRSGLTQDIDWSWSFDVMEWAMAEKKPTQGLKHIDLILQRLEQKRPKDCRGFLGFEKRWLQSNSDELLLLHDHEGTNDDFIPIIEKLLQLNIEFKAF